MANSPTQVGPTDIEKQKNTKRKLLSVRGIVVPLSTGKNEKMNIKRFYALLVAVLSLSAVSAQQANGEQTEVVDTAETNVIAYFCKRDTMKYNLQYLQFEATANDTVVKSYYEQDFQVCITDSTAEGYRLEYIATGFSREDTITVDTKAMMRQRVFERIKGKKLLFDLDEMGSVVQMPSWNAVRNDLIQGLFQAYNELYPLVPGLEQIVPKGQLMGIVSQRFQSEEGVIGWFDEIGMLFDLHGRSYESSVQVDNERTEEELPSTTFVMSGLLEDDDAIFEGDYFVTGATVASFEGDDVATYLKSKVSALGEDNELAKLMIQLAEADGKPTMSVEDAFEEWFFFNGWPMSSAVWTEEAIGKKTILQKKYLEWAERSWGNS